MLNIPSEVKALFKRDDIYKNFHVHFPNGEFRDLNNDDIVTESVSFTESLCSQQFLKFGLTEASEIRFECYGVPNVRGAVIQCAIEIDVSALGETWIAANLPDDPEETIPFLTLHVVRTGIGTGYYRIPYGEFTVDSCQRNHEQRIRRSIVAFTKIYSNNSDFSDFEQFMLGMHRRNKTTKMNVCDFVATALGYIPPEYTDITDLRNQFHSASSGYWDSYWLGDGTPNCKYTMHVKCNSYYSANAFPNRYRENYRLIKMGLVKSAGNSAIEDLQALFDQLGITGGYIDRLPSEQTTEVLSKYLTRGTAKELITAKWTIARWFFGTFEGKDGANIANTNGSNTFIYESDSLISFHNVWEQSSGLLAATVSIPTNITVKIYESWDSTSTVVFEETYDIYDNFSAYGYNIPARDELQNLEVTFDKTLDVPNSPYAGAYSFYNAYSIAKIINGYFELRGVFLRQNRDKTFSEFKVIDSVHEPITRSQYSNVFYEDDQVQPVGTIKYKFNDQKSEKATEYNFAYANPSVYDMTDNYVLQNLFRNKGEKDSEVETRINAALDAGFISNTESINYVKSDIEMQALPYVETGDTIDSETEDGETVETLVFNRTIKGIQMLRDTIESAGGEVIGRTEDD